MSGLLTVRIDKFLDGEFIEAGVPFSARRVLDGPDAKAAGRRTWTGVASVGPPSPPPYWAILELPAGRYDIEAVLPSGEVLEREVELIEGQQRELVMDGEPSPNEWRSWSEFGQSRAASDVEKASEAYRAPTDFAVLPSDARVGLGSVLAETGGHAANWLNWYQTLDRRAMGLGEGADALGQSPGDEDFGMSVEIIGGENGSPVLVRLSETRPTGPFDLSPAEFGRRRVFLSVSTPLGERVSAVPWPWPRSPAAPPAAGPFFELKLVERNGQLITDPVLRDPTYGGIIAYLNAGRFGRASQLLNAARMALFEKWTNPLAAAAGGYILLSAAESEEIGHWPDWLHNLATYFDIPDGAILRAKWLMDYAGGDHLDEARYLLELACERGLPYYSAGVAWLIDGLRRLAVEFPSCQERLEMVQGVARRMDLSQAFTCIELPAYEQEFGAENRARLGASPPVSNALKQHAFAELDEERQAVVQVLAESS